MTLTQYILQDRASGGDKYAVTIDNGILQITTSLADAQLEPIFEDSGSGQSGNYWKLFIENGILSIESTVTAQDDVIVLQDTTTSTLYKLVVETGELGYIDVFSSSVSLSTLALVTSVQTPTVSVQKQVTVALSTLTLAASEQVPTVVSITSVTVSLNTLTATLGLNNPTVSTIKSINVALNSLGATLTQQTPTIIVTTPDVTVSIGSLTLTSSVQTPIISVPTVEEEEPKPVIHRRRIRRKRFLLKIAIKGTKAISVKVSFYVIGRVAIPLQKDLAFVGIASMNAEFACEISGLVRKTLVNASLLGVNKIKLDENIITSGVLLDKFAYTYDVVINKFPVYASLLINGIEKDLLIEEYATKGIKQNYLEENHIITGKRDISKVLAILMDDI